MKISIAQILFPLIIILFFVLLMGCGNYNPPKIASHIVAVTLQGDTILVPIEKIRPNIVAIITTDLTIITNIDLGITIIEVLVILLTIPITILK